MTMVNELTSSIIHPNKRWFIEELRNGLKFPPVEFRKVNYINPPPRESLILGGSWNCYIHLPHYDERRAILENLYMPYQLPNSQYLKIRNGVLLWNRINLSAYTNLKDPSEVYLKKNDKFVIKMRFNESNILIEELL